MKNLTTTETEIQMILAGSLNPTRAYYVTELANAVGTAEAHWGACEAHSRLASMFDRMGDTANAEKHNAQRKAHAKRAMRAAA